MACCQCSHGPKAGFLPLLQLPRQVPCGCHYVSCSGLLLSDWREQCTMLVAGAEISKEDPREESWAGDATPGMNLPVWPWSPIPGHKRTEPYIQAIYSLPCSLLVPALWLWCAGMCVKLEVFLPR